jgi:peptide/nickel transport system substrate-binding protein
MRRRIAICVPVILVALGIVATVSSANVDRSSAASSLVIAIPLEPATLDVQLNSTAVNSPALVNIYETLTKLDRTSKLQPSLALSWKNLTRKTWRFNLRSGVTFQNGEKFTPAAAVFSIKRALTPTSQNLAYYPTVSDAKVVPGANAIVVTTNSPDALLPQQLSLLPMVPPKYVQQQPTQYLTHPIGTGPYVFDHWTQGQEFGLKANPHWWGGKARYQTFTIKIIPDTNVRAQALRAGEVQFATVLDPTSANQVPQYFAPASNVVCLVRLNNTVGPFTDLKLRQAANYAINRTQIIKGLFGKFGTVANGQAVTRASFGFDPALKDYPYDTAKAKSLLQQSGYKNQPISIVGTSGHWAGDRNILLAAVANLQAAGFNAKANIVEYSVWRTEYFASPKPAASFICTGDDGLTGFRPLANLAMPKGSQDAYVNQTTARDIVLAQGIVNDTARRKALSTIWTRLKTDAFAVPIGSVDQLVGAQKNIDWNSPSHGLVYANDIITLKNNK